MNGWDRRAAVDQSMPAAIWQGCFIISKTCHLHLLVRDVKTNSNVRKHKEGSGPATNWWDRRVAIDQSMPAVCGRWVLLNGIQE